MYVDEAFWGGLGRVLMSTLLDILRRQGFHLAVAGVTLPNPGSVALHRSLGYVRVGEFQAIGWKRGGWHGVDWYALELGPRDAAPAPIVPVRALDGLDSILRLAPDGRPARPDPRSRRGAWRCLAAARFV